MAETIWKWETDQDGIDNLRFVSAPMPEVGEDEVLVEIGAVSLNYRDTEVTTIHQAPSVQRPPAESSPQ